MIITYTPYNNIVYIILYIKNLYYVFVLKLCNNCVKNICKGSRLDAPQNWEKKKNHNRMIRNQKRRKKGKGIIFRQKTCLNANS